jgi:integrase
MENLEIVQKVQSDLERLAEIQSHARSVATIAAYASDYRSYRGYCIENLIEPEPVEPGNLALYLVELSQRGLKISTIARHATAVRSFAVRAGWPDPFDMSVRDVLRGLKRGQAGQYIRRQAKPMRLAELQSLVERIDLSVLGKRDRALLLIGWFGALRRSEIVALDRSDIDLTSDGLRIKIRKSKTDQDGSGYEIGLPRLDGSVLDVCDAWERWLDAATHIDPAGCPAFLHLGNSVIYQFTIAACCNRRELNRLKARSVCEILRRRLRAAQLSAIGYSGHSLRAGFATEAAARGVPEWAIQRHTRHRSTTSLRTYIRAGQLFGDNENAIKLMLASEAPKMLSSVNSP